MRVINNNPITSVPQMSDAVAYHSYLRLQQSCRKHSIKSDMVAILYPAAFFTSALIMCAYLYSPYMFRYRASENTTKYILLWSDPATAPFNFLGHGFDVFKANECEYTNCYVSHNRSDRSALIYFDVIVFNGRQLPKTWPEYRLPTQKYVYANLESPQNFPVHDSRLNNFFNWTWTYKLDSDLRWGYFTVYDLRGRAVGPKTDMHWGEMDPVTNQTKARLSSKNAAAAWFVSNCKTKSLREKLAKEIRKRLQRYNLFLHKYGACGSHDCGHSHCEDILEKNYYFYFAFENSLCDDYVTEKVLTALHRFTVPVVFGGANYSRFLPPGSYLDARELGARRLAARMAAVIDNHRNGDASMYHDFFRWRNHYSFKHTAESEDICNICRLVNDPVAMSTETVKEHFVEWWNQGVKCHRGRALEVVTRYLVSSK